MIMFFVANTLFELGFFYKVGLSTYILFMILSFFVLCKSLSSIGFYPPKPWLYIGIVGFCNGGISFLTGLKFFYIKVLNFNLWSKCRKLNWTNFSTPMENQCWNRRYLIVWLILIPLQESYLTSSIASCTCLPTSLLFSFLWRWKLQTHGRWISFVAKKAKQISSESRRSDTNMKWQNDQKVGGRDEEHRNNAPWHLVSPDCLCIVPSSGKNRKYREWKVILISLLLF